MSMLCPQDGRPCCDDLCHGGGCIALDGYPMLETCQFCGGTVDTAIPECSTCSCDDLGYGDPDEWREEEEVPAPPPDPAEAFLHTLQAFDQYLRDVLKGAADAIVQALGQVVSTFIASKALRDLKRAWNPYHRAKFHRNPKRRALRK